MMRVILVLLCTLLCSSQLFASHILGMDISYMHLEGHTYVVRLHRSQWCPSTVPQNAALSYVCPASGQTAGYTLPFVGTYQSSFESMPCEDTTSCTGPGPGSPLDVMRLVYADTIDFAGLANCSEGVLLSIFGARPSAVNYTSQPNVCAVVSFNPGKENSSAAIDHGFYPGLMSDEGHYWFSLAQSDPDGDSLRYYLDSALVGYQVVGGEQYIAYDTAGGYGAANPFSNFEVDSLSGMASVYAEIPTSYVTANFAVSVKVEEWDRQADTLKGTSNREMTFSVHPQGLANANPIVDSIIGEGGNPITLNEVVGFCAGESFSFDVYASDSNTFDTLSAKVIYDTSAFEFALTQVGANPAVFEVTGTVLSPAEHSRMITIRIDDDHCWLRGLTSTTLAIASPCLLFDTLSICEGDSLFLETHADSATVWTTLSGDTLDSTNFSCEDAGCTEVWLSPQETSSYLLHHWTSAGSSYFDTLTIMVTQFPTLIYSLSGPACDGQSFGLVVTAAEGTPINVWWDDMEGIIVHDSLDSTEVVVNDSGNYTLPIYVAVTPQCSIQDTYVLEVHPRPYFTHAGFYGETCIGEAFQLNPSGADSYHWSPSVYLSDSTGAPTCRLSGPMSYTLTGTNSFGCTETDQVSFSPNGNLLWVKGDFGAGQNVQGAVVEHFAYYDSLNSIIFNGFGPLNSQGWFGFGLYEPYHFFRVTPDTAFYPDRYIPSYPDGAFTVQSATPFATAYCDTVDLEIDMIVGPLLNGNGVVGGTVVDSATNLPEEGLRIILVDTVGNPLKWKQTDAFGYFQFSGIPEGTVGFYVDQWGLDNGVAPTYGLGPNALRDSLHFVLHPQFLELLAWPTGISDVGTYDVHCFPNPGNDLVTVQYPAAGSMLRVVNLMGQEVYAHPMNGTHVLTVSEWSPGTYMLQVTSPTGTVQTRKLVVTH